MASPTTGKAKKSIQHTGRPGLRRQQPVETNVQSYDRTDPFHAINALRRLLGSLASRIGGCQYRLTPDEHKLSLHLLTIVEPFVGLTPSRRSLTRQPIEILDAIAFHVESKRDLLALALSCHRLHSVVFPRHFDYHVVCAKASSISFWNHLIVNRALARNVRMLEIIDERSSKPLVLPADILKTDTDIESSDDELTLHSKQEKLFISALTKMTALKTFHWSCNHSTIPLDRVWETLIKCQSLFQVKISDNFVFLPYTSDTVKPKSVPVLPKLKSVTFQATKHVFGSTKTPALARVSGMLTSCPNVESLNIGYEHRSGPGQHFPVADDFFLCSRWPALRSLSLSNLRCSSVHSLESAAVFFAAHTNLEGLHLDLPLIDPEMAPELGDLHSSSPRTRSRACVLKGITLSGSDRDNAFFAGLKCCGSSVRRIELAGWHDLDDIRRLVECVPKLTWLDLNKSRRTHRGPEHGSHSHVVARRHEMVASPSNSTLTIKGAAAATGGPSVTTNAAEWAAVLAPLTELTTFIGVKFFYEVSTLTLATLASSSPTSLSPSELSRVRKNDKVAAVLERLDHWEEAGGRVIVLSRDGNEVRWEVKRLKV